MGSFQRPRLKKDASKIKFGTDRGSYERARVAIHSLTPPGAAWAYDYRIGVVGLLLLRDTTASVV